MSYKKSGRKFAAVMAVVILCVITIVSCSTDGDKEKVSSMQQFLPEQVLGWKAQPETETYDRESIFQYIDGAGEVYLSYGFKKVAVTWYDKPEAPEISAEIFDMGKAEDAYGVFSHSRDNEESGIGQGYEYRGSLLCFWKGPYFVCVRAEKDTPDSKEAVFALAREIDSSISETGQKPPIVDLLPTPNLSRGSVRFFHGHPSLNYHYFLAEENLLQLGDETDAVLGKYNPGGVTLLCIHYPSADLASQAYNSFAEGYLPEGAETGAGKVENGKWVVAEVIEDYVIIVFDVKHEMAGRTLLKACRAKIEATSE
jgi:hypothetical protein